MESFEKKDLRRCGTCKQKLLLYRLCMLNVQKKNLLVRGTHHDLEHPEGIQPPDTQKTSIQRSEPSRPQYLGSFVSSYRHFSKKPPPHADYGRAQNN